MAASSKTLPLFVATAALAAALAYAFLSGGDKRPKDDDGNDGSAHDGDGDVDRGADISPKGEEGGDAKGQGTAGLTTATSTADATNSESGGPTTPASDVSAGSSHGHSHSYSVARTKERSESDATPRMENRSSSRLRLAALDDETASEGGMMRDAVADLAASDLTSTSAAAEDTAAAETTTVPETSPPVPKKKKKVRPKLTPVGPSKSTDVENEEDDEGGALGYGDIAVSASPPRPSKKSPLKSLQSPSVEAPSASKSTVPSRTKLRPVASVGATKGKDVEEGEEAEKPDEHAGFSKLSTYWKEQEHRHVFVAPTTPAAVGGKGSPAMKKGTAGIAKKGTGGPTKGGAMSSIPAGVEGMGGTGGGRSGDKEAKNEGPKKEGEGTESGTAITAKSPEVVPVAEPTTVTTTAAEETEGTSDEGAVAPSEPTPAVQGEEAAAAEDAAATVKGDMAAEEPATATEAGTPDADAPSEDRTLVEDAERRGSDDDAHVERSGSGDASSNGSGSGDASGDASDDPRLIVPAASYDSGGDSGSSGASQEYVKIVRTPTGDAMTESEFLARPILDVADAAAVEDVLQKGDDDVATDAAAAATNAEEGGAAGGTDDAAEAVAAKPSETEGKDATTKAGEEAAASGTMDEGAAAEASESPTASTADASMSGSGAGKKRTNRKKKKRKGKKK